MTIQSPVLSYLILCPNPPSQDQSDLTRRFLERSWRGFGSTPEDDTEAIGRNASKGRFVRTEKPLIRLKGSPEDQTRGIEALPGLIR